MFDIQFANKEYLYGLIAVPVLAALFLLYLAKRKRDMQKIGNSAVLRPLMPEYSKARPIIRFALLTVALAFVIIAAARPRMGSKLSEVKTQGSEIMILLDISNSMRATDMYPNRLENTKNAISNLVKKLSGDKIGLVIFAGTAFVQVPLTSDLQATDIFVQSVSCDMISEQGTALGEAINLGARSFSTESETSKAMILITDGENHEANPDPIAAAKNALDKGIVTFTIGMGSPRGTTIPKSEGSSEMMRDKEGNIVITKLDEKSLIEIANAGGGSYAMATNGDSGLKAIYEQIGKMKKGDILSYSEYDEKYAVPTVLALVFFIAACFTLQRKNRWINKLGIFD